MLLAGKEPFSLFFLCNGHKIGGRQRRKKALERRKRKKKERKERKRDCTLMQARSGYTFFFGETSDYGGSRGKHNFKKVFVTLLFLTPI